MICCCCFGSRGLGDGPAPPFRGTTLCGIFVLKTPWVGRSTFVTNTAFVQVVPVVVFLLVAAGLLVVDDVVNNAQARWGERHSTSHGVRLQLLSLSVVAVV